MQISPIAAVRYRLFLAGCRETVSIKNEFELAKIDSRVKMTFQRTISRDLLRELISFGLMI
jgi:hypothetical protein